LVLEEEGYIFLNEDELWPQGFYPTTYLVGAVDFIKKPPQVVKEWVKAHLDLTVRLQTNPEEYMAEINREMEKWMGKPLPMKILRSAFSRLHFTCRPMEEPFMVMAERAYCLGFLQEMPTNLSAGFELTFLEEGLKELGYAEIP
jgi:NitT/TauT family transport system substrate-binding protein